MNATVARWRWVAASSAFLCVAALVAVLAPATQAAFIDTTGNVGNDLRAANLQPVPSFNASCQSSSRVNLSWTPSPTTVVTGYRIERRRQGESVFSPLATVTGRTTTAYSDQSSPFPSNFLSVLGTVTVTYRIRAEIAGTTWRSTHAQASASGTVVSVLFIGLIFNCN